MKGGLDKTGLELESLPSLVCETVSELADMKAGEIYTRTWLNCTPLHGDHSGWERVLGKSGSLKQICYVRPGLNREVAISGPIVRHSVGFVCITLV